MYLVWNTLRVSVLIARHTELGPEWHCADVCDPFGRIYCVEAGEGFVTHHGRQYRLCPGRLYVVPAYTRHSYFCPRSLVMHWLHFTAEVLGGLELFEFLCSPYEVTLQDTEHVVALMRRLQRIYGGGAAMEDFEAMGLLLQLLALFQARSDPDARARRRTEIDRFREALGYIETHLHERVRVDRLARIAHLERSHFTRLFGRCFGMSPSRYIMRKRIERTQQMLWQTDDTLATIAARLGFSDAFHLSKSFRRITGMSPGRFRRRGSAAMP